LFLVTIGKLLAIRELILEGLRPPVLIFMQSVQRAKALYEELQFEGLRCGSIHAERTSVQREKVRTMMKNVENENFCFLFCFLFCFGN
jgi:ATP-dependent RNA helicase DDX52/ROK1